MEKAQNCIMRHINILINNYKFRVIRFSKYKFFFRPILLPQFGFCIAFLVVEHVEDYLAFAAEASYGS